MSFPLLSCTISVKERKSTARNNTTKNFRDPPPSPKSPQPCKFFQFIFRRVTNSERKKFKKQNKAKDAHKGYTRSEWASGTLEHLGIHNIVVYCGREWPDFFGNDFDTFSDLPLIYAHYDNVPSYYDFSVKYGGWRTPSGKQFWDGVTGEQICGADLDWDWSAVPFWA